LDLEFVGGLRESADLRKQNFIPAQFVKSRLLALWTIEIMQQIGNDRRQEIHRLDLLVRFASRQNEQMQ